MSKKGRPKKKDAIKPGHLVNGLCRFTFIADKKKVQAIKQIASAQKISIKDYMDNLISNDENISKEMDKMTEVKKPVIVAKTKTEKALLSYLLSRKAKL